MEQTKEAILKKYPHGKLSINGSKAWQETEVLRAMQAYSDQNTATMYTHSEVLKIAEAVKAECTKRLYSCGVYTSIEDSIKLLDVNQFIPKKG